MTTRVRQHNTLTVCVVGGGPRGLSVVERLCANAAASRQRLTVHLVDPHLRLGGRVWRADQPSVLLMNTVASQVTLFTDESVTCEGPISDGPSLYEWARLLESVEQEVPYPPHVYEECRRLGPDSYPTRALFGRYLGWVLDRVVRTAPDHIAVESHGATAREVLDEDDTTQTVRLDDGTRLTGLDAVVLAVGHVDMPRSVEERALGGFAAEHGLVHLPTGNPADADLDRIAPGQRVALRGMGLNFFDYMSLLTAGRGGSFVRDGTGGALRYLPSGMEPVLLAGSRRGVPFHSRGENQKGATGRHHPLFLTPDAIGRLRARRAAGEPVGFVRDIWPLVDREVRAVYYHTLISESLGRYDGDVFLEEFCRDGGSGETEERLLSRYAVDGARRWDWDRIARPYGRRTFAGTEDYDTWLVGHLRQDIAEARRGNVRGPLKAALDVMRDLRNEIRQVVDHSGITGDSYRDDLRSWYTPLNGFVSIGPPPSRIEEMVALMEAGVLRVAGPGMTVHPSAGRKAFLVRSAAIPDAEDEATVLIEARLPEVDVRTTDDPLLRQLMSTGAASAYTIPNPSGKGLATGGLAVTGRPYRVLDAKGEAHPYRFAFGIPTESVHWATAAGIRPGSDSVILGDADAIARAALAAGTRSGAIGATAPGTTAEGE
ncbi:MULTISPECIES: FAD/NAD(P)-binding protein [unclassified Streptomyces]|uniref:FAD/NAD(P)-binding protein n=1 Tax=unclassified Streptomyces TaxID=2593676 RepID=UPI00380CF118